MSVTKTKNKLMYFRLLIGVAYCKNINFDSSKSAEDQTEPEILKYQATVAGGRCIPPYAIIPSYDDLVKKHGSDKFERLDDLSASIAMNQNKQFAEYQQEKQEEAPPVEESRKHTENELAAMTVDQLRSLAEESEIDLGEATKKQDIISVLLTAGV